MNRAGLALAIVFALAKPVLPVPAISYFSNVRDIRISHPEMQNYFVVDPEIWKWAQPDLDDLRIYDGDAQVQYKLSEERGGTSTIEMPARILNLGSVRGHTEFDLDAGQISEYDRIRLQLDAKDFVATASVAGSDQPGSRMATQLPPSTLYDFSREELGSNEVLKLPPSNFRTLHVRLSSGIAPSQVKRASVYNLQESKAVWSTIGSCSPPTQVARTTVVLCNSGARIPVERVRFKVDAKQVNFRRVVTFSDANGTRYGSGGEITRVRIKHAGTAVISEDLDVPIGVHRSGRLQITLENGDNPPLSISGVELLSVERRVYFDPQGKDLLKLYYGDDKLPAPVYDYARFYIAEPAAAQAELGPAAHNAAYRGRPDERPWSERHKVVLWVAMIMAVIVLGVVAIRGLTASPKSS